MVTSAQPWCGGRYFSNGKSCLGLILTPLPLADPATSHRTHCAAGHRLCIVLQLLHFLLDSCSMLCDPATSGPTGYCSLLLSRLLPQKVSHAVRVRHQDRIWRPILARTLQPVYLRGTLLESLYCGPC